MNDEQFDKLTREYKQTSHNYQKLFDKLFGLRPVEPGGVPPTVNMTEQELQRLDEFERKLNNAHKRWFEAANQPKSRQRKT